MWVPLVENKEYDGDGADYFVKKYIDTILQKDPDIDTLILGCTHYPCFCKDTAVHPLAHPTGNARRVCQRKPERLSVASSGHGRTLFQEQATGVSYHRIGREIPGIGFGILTLHRRTCTQCPT